MNIFVVDRNPVKAARALCDSHVVKMILESCQLLSTYDFLHGRPEGRFAPTHRNHPCRVSLENPGVRRWLRLHLGALLDEYERRFGRAHACRAMYLKFWKLPGDSGPFRFPENAFAAVMPERFRRGGIVRSYRAYYRYKKQTLLRWNYTRAAEPVWLKKPGSR